VPSDNKKNKNKGGRKKRRAQAITMVAGRVPRSVRTGINYPARIRALWNDPCNAEMVHPPYAGTTSGYLMRTVDIITPDVLGNTFTPGTKVVQDVYLQWTPSNYSDTTGFVYGMASPGTAPLPLQSLGKTSFITNSALVRAFRPVASCLEWVPTGAIGDRAGIVGMSSTPNTPISSASSVNAMNLLSVAAHTEANAAGHYEVKWLPTSLDEEFETKNELSHTGCGSVSILLKNVDATYTTTSIITANGFFRATTVWEWTPVATLGVLSAVTAPPPYTSQQIIAGLGMNMKDFLYGTMRAGIRMGLGYGANYLRRRAGQSLLMGREDM
jgi:hypothetical protein